MTRSTNMEHVEVLRVLRDRWAGPDERVALDAAIAALSAPQPPAEAQPVAWMRRCAFDRVDVLTLAKSDRPRGWNMHAVTENKALPDDVPLYAHLPPSAPVGVEGESVLVGNLPTMNQDGYPGLGEWWVQLWRGDEIIARVYGDGPDEVRSQAQDIADALNQQPAAVDEAAVRWAVERWNDEVANRPLVNVHRRTLDITWRQVIRHFGGDDVTLCGPRHDDLA